MRRTCLAYVLSCSFLATACFASTKHTVVTKLPMPMTAPLFLENDMYSSKLYLVNSLNFGVDAAVTLYDMSGSRLTTKHYFLKANSQQAIGIKQILTEGGLYSEAGSVEVISPTNSSALLGQLSITRSGTNQSYLDEEMFMPNKKGSQTLRAVIDSPQNSPVVAITNVSSSTTQTLHVRCIPSSGSSVSKTLTIQPKQTQLVRSCSTAGDVVFSPTAAEGQFSLSDNDETGMSGRQVAGISITTDGPPSDIAAFGFVEHNDEYGDISAR